MIWKSPLFLLIGVLSLQGAAGHQVTTFSGETLKGTVTTDSQGFVVTAEDGTTTKVAPVDILEAQFIAPDKDDSKENFPGGVVLVNGSAIPKAPKKKMADEVFQVAKLPAKIPPAAVSKFIYPSTSWELARQATPETGVQLKNGDFFVGPVASREEKSVVINSLLFGPQTFDPGKVSAIVVKPLPTVTSALEVRTTNGALLMAEDLRITGNGIAIHDRVLGTLEIALEDLASIKAGAGRILNLATEKPGRIDPPQGLSPGEAISKVQPEDGGAASIAAALNAAVHYAVPQGFTVFKADVRLPETTQPGLRVVFALYADGRSVFRSPPMTMNDPARPVRIKFGVARALTLRIESEDPAPPGATGEWIEPMLLKSNR